MNLIEILAETSNGIGKTGLLDKFGNVFGIVLAVFGVIMILFSAKVVDRRSSEIAGRTFSEMQLSLTCDGETYFRWTPDLGLDGDVQIEYNPDNPEEFYIVDKVDGDDSPDVDEDGEVVEDLKEPPNKAFYAMLVFGIVLLALGCGFLYDFYFIK